MDRVNDPNQLCIHGRTLNEQCVDCSAWRVDRLAPAGEMPEDDPETVRIRNKTEKLIALYFGVPGPLAGLSPTGRVNVWAPPLQFPKEPRRGIYEPDTSVGPPEPVSRETTHRSTSYLDQGTVVDLLGSEDVFGELGPLNDDCSDPRNPWEQ